MLLQKNTIFSVQILVPLEEITAVNMLFAETHPLLHFTSAPVTQVISVTDSFALVRPANTDC